MAKKKKYELKKTLLKVARLLLFIGIPVIAVEFPAVLDMTVGGILYGIADWLKHEKGIKIPIIG